jgi:hypothetical protein
MNNWKDDLQEILDQDPHNIYGSGSARNAYDNCLLYFAKSHGYLFLAKEELAKALNVVSDPNLPFQESLRQYIIEKMKKFLDNY